MDEDQESTAGMHVGTSLEGEHGTRISAAVVRVAKKIEDHVSSVVAASVAPAATQPASVPGALSIRQVRMPSGKLSAAKPVPAAAAQRQWQPHIQVAVAPIGGG